MHATKTPRPRPHRGGRAADSLGLRPDAPWLAVVLLYAVLGPLVIGLSLFDLTPPRSALAMRWAGAVAFGTAPVWLLMARARVDIRWFHVPAVTGTLIIAGGQLFTGGVRGALLIAFIIPPIVVAMVMNARHAAPHVALGAVLTAIYGATVVGDHAAVYALVTTIVVTAAPAMLIAIQAHMRSVVARNVELSQSDPLTGVGNLRVLLQRIDDELARMRRSGARFALVTIDLDEFKLVNDTINYATGDRMLVAVARALETPLTRIDLVARRGGDEFSVVAPEIPGRDFDQLCVDLANVVAGARSEICPTLNPTASVAYVTPLPDDDTDALIARGDAALMKAKHRGRTAPREWPGAADGARVARSLLAGRHAAGEVSRVTPPGGPTGKRGTARTTTAASTEHTTAGPKQQVYRLGWRIAATMLAATGVSLAAIGLLGESPARSSASTMAAAVLALSLAPVCVVMARKGARAKLLAHAIVLASAGTMTLLSAGAGDTSGATLDLFLLLVFSAFYFFPTREAIVHLTLYLALYEWLLATSDFPYAELRLIWSTAIVIVLAVMFAAARRRTAEYGRQNEQLALIDPLTGIANRRALITRLKSEIARCELIGGRLSLMMLDLDEFKLVNDRHTHSVGDRVLRDVATAIDGAIRQGDLAARRGGDEFAVVATGGEPVELAALQDRIMAAIAGARSAVCPDIATTAGITHVAWRPGDTADALMLRADADLQTVKGEIVTAQTTAG